MPGSILRWEPPRVLSYTFGDHSDVTFELTPQNGEVLLVLTHRSRDEDLPHVSDYASGWHLHLLHLIALLEAEAPEAERARPLSPPLPAAPVPVGEPTNREMVQAVRDWLNDDVKPGAEGHAKFQVAVAMNALGIVMRDLDANVRAEDKRLADALMAGTTTLADPGLLANLRRAVLDKCAVDSPKYAALARARGAWDR